MNPLYTLNLHHNIFQLKYSVSIEMINAETNKLCHLNVSSHSIIIDSLILPLNYNFKRSTLKILYLNNIIWDISLSFILKICKPHIYKNNIYIQISNILGEYPIEFPMFNNKFNNIYIIIESKQNFTYGLTFKKKYYIANTFTTIQNFIYTIHQYKSTDINLPNNIIKKNATTGLYIEINKLIDRLIFFVNSIAIIEFNINIMPHYNNLIYKKKYWSNKNNILLIHLKKYLPIRIINLIINHCNNFNEYLYWFPLNIDNNNDKYNNENNVIKT